MDAPAADRCPRCGGAFHCGIGEPGPCPCTTIALDAPTLQSLRARYAGCLCLRCLGELAQAASVRAAGVDRAG
jgi:hypothetical protein